MEIRDEMKHMLARVGWKQDFIDASVPILPISGWMGDNLIKKSDKMTWWKGQDVKTMDSRTIHVDCLLDVSGAHRVRARVSAGVCRTAGALRSQQQRPRGVPARPVLCDGVRALAARAAPPLPPTTTHAPTAPTTQHRNRP